MLRCAIRWLPFSLFGSVSLVMSASSNTSKTPRREHSPFAALASVTVLTGIGAGLGGMLLALLLRSSMSRSATASLM